MIEPYVYRVGVADDRSAQLLTFYFSGGYEYSVVISVQNRASLGIGLLTAFGIKRVWADFIAANA